MAEIENKQIVLATLNARYIHSSFGLRYLMANMGELENQCCIREFTLESKPEDVVEQLLSLSPSIVILAVYIWNVVQTESVIRLLKEVAPEVIVQIGGPEVSYELEQQSIVQAADYVITGWGDVSAYKLCTQLLLTNDKPDEKIIKGEQAKLCDIRMPYYLYTDEDIKNRIVYVEASRGCPFKCEFCLSALDKTAWPFDLDLFLAEMDTLHKRGARHFKFVDRTFNLKINNSIKILQFFLDRMSDDLFLHFEVIPDHLPDALKDMITKFPSGSLQFEIGIQTFNPDVQALISRRQDNEKAKQNLQWIRQQSNAYIHADLIFGLPGEDINSFETSFNQLYNLKPHEIQVGILKRLKGSPIIRHVEPYQLRFNPSPPFNVLSTSLIDYPTMQRMNRFARYWDMLANSGRFANTMDLLLGDKAFRQFMKMSDALFARTGQTHKISLFRLFDLVFDIAIKELDFDVQQIHLLLAEDFSRSGQKSIPKFITRNTPAKITQQQADGSAKHKIRQARHST